MKCLIIFLVFAVFVVSAEEEKKPVQRLLVTAGSWILDKLENIFGGVFGVLRTVNRGVQTVLISLINFLLPGLVTYRDEDIFTRSSSVDANSSSIGLNDIIGRGINITLQVVNGTTGAAKNIGHFLVNATSDAADNITVSVSDLILQAINTSRVAVNVSSDIAQNFSDSAGSVIAFMNGTIQIITNTTAGFVNGTLETVGRSFNSAVNGIEVIVDRVEEATNITARTGGRALAGVLKFFNNTLSIVPTTVSTTPSSA